MFTYMRFHPFYPANEVCMILMWCTYGHTMNEYALYMYDGAHPLPDEYAWTYVRTVEPTDECACTCMYDRAPMSVPLYMLTTYGRPPCSPVFSQHTLT